MSDKPLPTGNADAIEGAASAWLARRDRGLTAGEQDDFLQWLREDPRHGQTLKKLEKAWGALDLLAEWRPAHSAQPNPDLLARPPQRFRRRRSFAVATSVTVALAAAAAVAIGLFVSPSAPPPRAAELSQPAAVASRAVRVIPSPERRVLADGSIVEVNHGGRIETAFSDGERRVRLVRGEAYFSVAKDSTRPFSVSVEGIAVRAVGTEFNVRRAATAMEVLVTEGSVEIAPSSAPAFAGTDSAAAARTLVAAGERLVVELDARPRDSEVVAVSAREIESALAWKGVRLEFEELPLSEVVAEFNLRNRQQLEIGDPAVAGLRVGGTFRADNVGAFARLLELSFGVAVEQRTDGTLVLRGAADFDSRAR